MPDHELARLGGLSIDPVAGDCSPTPPAGRAAGVLAAGNLLHAAETADVAALCGRHAAGLVVGYLGGEPWPDVEPILVRYTDPLRWVSPGAPRPGEGGMPHGHLLARVSRFVPSADVQVCQGGRVLWSGRLRRLVPNRPVHLPAGWVDRVRPDAGDVHLRVYG